MKCSWILIDVYVVILHDFISLQTSKIESSSPTCPTWNPLSVNLLAKSPNIFCLLNIIALFAMKVNFRTCPSPCCPFRTYTFINYNYPYISLHLNMLNLIINQPFIFVCGKINTKGSCSMFWELFNNSIQWLSIYHVELLN